MCIPTEPSQPSMHVQFMSIPLLDRTILPSNSVEFVSNRRHANPCPPRGHGRHHMPAIRSGVVGLTVSVDGKQTAPT